MSISITVKNTAGDRFQMEITSLDETVSEFKHRLETESGIPAASQRLIFRGHILKDSQSFADIKSKHGLESGHSMHVVPAPSASNRPSSATPPNSSRPSSNPTPPIPGIAGAGGTGGVPDFRTLGGLGGMGGMGGTGGMGGMGGTGGAGGTGGQRGLAGMGLDDMLQMHQQMMRNPEQMQAMLNSPMMDSLMNNPEVARSLMMINPQMRELMERNPEVAHVFNDPSTFRQMVQMARNPSLLNEMLRNTDRQMANIEMMPGGFDALRRMHENIQAPLMDAAQGGFTTNNGGGNPSADSAPDDNPFSSLFQPQNTPSNAPMPNPWAPNNGVPTQRRTTSTNPSTAQASDTNAFASLFQTPSGGNGGTAPEPNQSTNGTTGNAPQIPGLPPGMTPDRVFQMLENPMMQQLMQNILSDPQMFQAMISSNPQLQAMMRTNPDLARVLQNPEILRTVLNPEVTRSLMQFQEMLTRGGMGGGFGVTPSPSQAPTAGAQTNQQPNGSATSAQDPPPAAWPSFDSFMTMMNAINAMNSGSGTGTATETNLPSQTGVRQNSVAAAPNAATNADGSEGTGNLHPNAQTNASAPRTSGPNGAQTGWPNMESFMAMMNAANAMANGMGPSGGAAPTQQLTQEQLEEMYSSQLAQLRDMGFLDKSMCLQALQQSQGNVSAAIENLLSRFGG